MTLGCVVLYAHNQTHAQDVTLDQGIRSKQGFDISTGNSRLMRSDNNTDTRAHTHQLVAFFFFSYFQDVDPRGPPVVTTDQMERYCRN